MNKTSLFLSGYAVLATALLVVCLYIGSYERPLRKYFSAEYTRHLVYEFPWISTAKIIRQGGVLVISPSRTNAFSALIVPVEAPFYPWIIVNSGTGIAANASRSISIFDATGKEFDVADRNGDGVLDFYSVTLGSGSNETTMVDRDCDGAFDLCLKPAGESSVCISNEWHRIRYDGEGRLMIEGQDR